jgi:serine/threonine-protein kinase
VQGREDIERQVDELVRAGRYAEAAAALRTAGELSRAQALYEKIWDFRAAAECARERGDRPALLRLLLDAKEFAEAARVGQELLTAAPGEQARAAEVYERRRQWSEAAALREALGQLEEAHTLYKKAQQPLEAARLDETLGRVREAGILYERLLADEPGSPDAARAHLQLGRILAGFGRHDQAVRQLQKVSEGGARLEAGSPAFRARRLLVAELVALGYRDAASSVLDRLRAADARIPPLEAFLANERRDRSGEPVTRLAGRYEVQRLIGSGGMGRVYLAQDGLTGQAVAVKVVAPPTDERLASGYRRFVREAQVVSSLHHPNVVGVVGFHEELGILAMEYLAGGTLADRLPGPLSPAQVRTLLVEIVSGLEAAHAHGVIHRDIKPANLFFASSGEAKLGDFGVAHLQDLGATQTAGFIGTLAYMSPEQISGAPLQFSTDIYALGVTAFQALTGRLPFRGPDFVAQHLGDRPPPPSSLRPGLDPEWDRVILRALEKDPRARFASLEELRHALAAIPVDGNVDVDANANVNVNANVNANVSTNANVRYAVGGTLSETAHSVVEHGTDLTLGREIIIERFRPGYFEREGAAHLRWLRALARHGGPSLQRVLRIEPQPDGSTRAVFEAVSGQRPPTWPRPAVETLRRALAPLHAEGMTHGSLTDSIVLEEHGPTLLVAGRSPTSITVADEQRQLASLIST